MYGGLGIGAAIPIVHLILYESYFKDPSDMYSTGPSVIYYVLVGVFYLGGLYIYTVRAPERFKPGNLLLIKIKVTLIYVGLVTKYGMCPY